MRRHSNATDMCQGSPEFVNKLEAKGVLQLDEYGSTRFSNVPVVRNACYLGDIRLCLQEGDPEDCYNRTRISRSARHWKVVMS